MSIKVSFITDDGTEIDEEVIIDEAFIKKHIDLIEGVIYDEFNYRFNKCICFKTESQPDCTCNGIYGDVLISEIKDRK